MPMDAYRRGDSFYIHLDLPGIAAAARRDDENPYGLTATLEGGARVWWTITGAGPAGSADGGDCPG